MGVFLGEADEGVLRYGLYFGSADLGGKVSSAGLLGTVVGANLEETVSEIVGKGVSLAEGQLHT